MSSDLEENSFPYHGGLLLLYLFGVGGFSGYLFWGNMSSLLNVDPSIYEYSMEVQVLAHMSTVIWLGRVIGVVAIILWKKRGVYLLGMLFVPGVVTGLTYYPSVADVVMGLSAITILVLLVRPKWKLFD